MQTAESWYDAKDISTGSEQTLPNRGTGSDTAQRGSTTGSDANDPTFTTGSPNYIAFDGTDDYIQLPASATPTFTATTGNHTIVMCFRIAAAQANYDYFYGNESDGTTGLSIRNGADDKAYVRLNSTQNLSRTTQNTIPIDTLHVVAVTIDAGDMNIWDNVDGYYLAAIDITGVGSLTSMTDPRIGSKADSVASNPAFDMLAFLDWPSTTLTTTQLTDIAAKLIAGTYT
jgi:hypothetical protein